MSRVIQQNWLVDTIGCVFPFGPCGLYLTRMDQVGNDLLSRISRVRVSAESGITEVSRRKVDEAGCTHFYVAPFLKRRH